MNAGHVQEASALVQQAWEAGDRLDHVVAGFNAAWIGAGIHMGFDTARAIELTRNELSKPRVVQAPAQRDMLRGSLAVALSYSGHLAEAREALEGVPGQELNATVLQCVGEWRAAETVWRRGRDESHRTGNKLAWSMCTRFLGRQLSWRGELVESEALLREWLEDSSSVPAEILTRVDLVELLVKSADLAGAAAELAAVDALLDRHPLSTSSRSLRDVSAALLLAAEERHEEAAAAAERAAEGLGAASIPWDEARAYALWSRVLRAAGDESGAVEKLVAAHDVLERIDAPPVWRDWVLASAE